MGPDEKGLVTNTQEAAIVPGKPFSFLFLLYLRRLNTLILIETSDGSETESAAWTGGRYKTEREAKIFRQRGKRERKRGLKKKEVPAATQTNI